MKSLLIRVLAFLFLGVSSPLTIAADPAEMVVRGAIARMFPDVEITRVRPAPVPW